MHIACRDDLVTYIIILILYQEYYIKKLLRKFDKYDFKIVSTPYDINSQLKKDKSEGIFYGTLSSSAASCKFSQKPPVSKYAYLNASKCKLTFK